MALAFVSRQARKGDDNVVNQAMLEDRYLETELEVLRDIMGRKDTIGRHVMRAALKFEGEYSLATWLETENRDKGVAPNTGLVLRHLRKPQEKPEALSPLTRTASTTFGGLKWVQRFRHRWRLLRGRFPARERIPVEELREKAIILTPHHFSTM